MNPKFVLAITESYICDLNESLNHRYRLMNKVKYFIILPSG